MEITGRAFISSILLGALFIFPVRAKAANGSAFRLSVPKQLQSPVMKQPSLQFKNSSEYDKLVGNVIQLNEKKSMDVPGRNFSGYEAIAPHPEEEAPGGDSVSGIQFPLAGVPRGLRRFSRKVITPGRQGPGVTSEFRNGPGIPPGLFPSERVMNGEAGQWGSSTSKTHIIKDTGSVFYTVSGNYNMPEGIVMDPGNRVYAFNAISRFTSRKFDKTIAGVQVQSGYLPGSVIPMGATLFANSEPLKKLSVSGKYSLNMTYTGLTPESRYERPLNYNDQMAGTLTYKLTPKLDLNGSVTRNTNSAVPGLAQYVYEGGMALKPGASNDIHTTLRLTKSGPMSSYEALAGYDQKVSSKASLSFNSDLQEDWAGMVHGRLDMSYGLKKGKFVITPSSGVGMDEVSRFQNLYSWNLMLKLTAPLGLFF